MAPTWKGLIRLAAGLVAAFVACSHGEHEDRVAQAYLALVDREQAHHADVGGMADPAAVRGETELYAADMDALMSAMMLACADMMDDDAFGKGAYDDVDRIRGRMAVAIEHHREAEMALEHAGAMQDECDEHHDAMTEMLDEMFGALPDDVANDDTMMGRGMHR